ncbi:glycosyl hydrolase [Leisingera sp. SS27]|uniref:glycosyl hydrolase n=1 Tax=Leisingera sp. SS27 TaxID=2979462 RepID=UPI00232CACA2|nr:glycosyl hydrolase [Leisingera sp. SS27]MDC0657191.1 glycosyl hydrolase [Leisingera sp. SS27]
MLVAWPAAAQKAGVGAWENSSYSILSWIEDTPGLGWYYNWRPDQMYHKGRQSRSVEFVPMIHGARDVNKRIRSDHRVSALLGFNEPDGRSGGHQAGMSVKQAIKLWPRLERHGLRLGSPATTQSGTLGHNSWLRRFMDQAEARGLRVDFMAVHYYSEDGSVKDFERWLRAVHREYGRPVWVTEFAHIDWTRPASASHAQNAAFARKAIAMMERLPFVERHAWFAANPYPWQGRVPQINLLNDDLSPTAAGDAFARAVSRAAGLQVASN